MGRFQYKTLRESIVEEIRFRIVNQELEPGEKIVEMDLAEEFQTSRAPIREALRQLENEGLIIYTRNAGCSVREITVRDAYEIYMLRAGYETMSVRLLNGKIPEKVIERMEAILEKMRGLTEETYYDVFKYDNALHEELVKMVELPRLLKAWKILDYGNIITSRTKNLEKKKVAERQYPMHKELVDLCKEGDCEKTCAFISEHYGKTIRKLLAESEDDSFTLEWDFIK